MTLIDATAGSAPRYPVGALIDFARALLAGAGMQAVSAQAVAEVLVEGDCLGHDTHGLALLAGYLGELDSGAMRGAGEPRVLAERTVAATWDGQRLPGSWLISRAMDVALERIEAHSISCTSVRTSPVVSVSVYSSRVRRAPHPPGGSHACAKL